ncbi:MULTISPECIES: hypothetical protein [unclassified Iodobacter]|nr:MULTISPECIES: hypothetical protein [unclassified Iodobacter]MDW5418587.1 hypothetical protein [Iodobacter sp. CM08]
MFSEKFELIVSLVVVLVWLVITGHLFSPLLQHLLGQGSHYF